MLLSTLASTIAGARLLPGPDGRADVEVTGLAYDSRRVEPGDLFFCIRGAKSDGHGFLPEVSEKGAAAAVVEDESAPRTIPALLVRNVRAAMPDLATAFFDYPSRRLSLVGVTGTNGKTTTTYLIEALAKAAGRSTGVIGTIGARINDQALPGERTTPEAPDLQELLARMAEAGGSRGTVVAMEVSSHALAQDRTRGCEYEVGVFTNLTQDHLDYHKDMEDYFQAKALLFTRYPEQGTRPFTGVLNVDDPYGRRLADMTKGKVLTYGVEGQADLRASGITGDAGALRFDVTAREGVFPIQLRLGGLFNVFNSLAAMGAARALGIEWDVIVPALASASGVPGRFESVETGQDFHVIVDYAHSPDGVDNVLRAARALNPRRLIVVFGCGGDRDRTKRPIMGRIAAELADQVVVTSDNPRSEDPEAIIAEILTGTSQGAARVDTIVDRRAAIEHAVRLAGPGDLVVIAGKGHEDYQIFADRTIHFDDREEARNAAHARLSA
jgi:UDP-N-acetylmuramoyl-L-alanyl-D-glutamate--2,6-diaminopimelate ligase